jgi:hypothetical protein
VNTVKVDTSKIDYFPWIIPAIEAKKSNTIADLPLFVQLSVVFYPVIPGHIYSGTELCNTWQHKCRIFTKILQFIVVMWELTHMWNATLRIYVRAMAFLHENFVSHSIILETWLSWRIKDKLWEKIKFSRGKGSWTIKWCFCHANSLIILKNLVSQILQENLKTLLEVHQNFVT